MDKLKQYGYNLYVSVDMLINSVLGGDPRMTISARMGRAVLEGRCKFCGWMCSLLNYLQTDHCQRANAREKTEGKDEVIKF